MNELDFLACIVCKKQLEKNQRNLRCSNCGANYYLVDGIPIIAREEFSRDVFLSQVKWDEFYNGFSDQEIVDGFMERKQEIEMNLMPLFERFWDIKEGKTYLEIGCGPSYVGAYLAGRGLKFVGVDMSLQGLKIASKVFSHAGINEKVFVLGELSNIPLLSNRFDFVYGGGVIEHVKNPQPILDEIYRVLKTGGNAINTVPCLSFAYLYRQLSGNIPDLPVFEQLAEFFHMKLLGGRHMEFGYEKSFLISKLFSRFRHAGFRDIQIGAYETYLPISKVKNQSLKQLIRRITKYRICWPMVYVSAIK